MSDESESDSIIKAIKTNLLLIINNHWSECSTKKYINSNKKIR